MHTVLNRPIAAAIGAIAFGNAGIGSATAADIPTTPQAQVQPPPPDYYAGPPVEEDYGYPPPPPTVYYEYATPPVIITRPYYFGRHYGPIYGGHPYGERSYGPYVAHGYGHYYHQWGRGYRGW